MMHMDSEKLMAQRKEYNERILYGHSPLYVVNIKYKDVIPFLKKKLSEHPSLRFGQVVCNDICPDYRDEEPSKKTKDIMQCLFWDSRDEYRCKCDPFYEEPLDTWNRWCRMSKDALAASNDR